MTQAEPRALSLVTEASRMLAEARTLDDIRHVHNLAQRAQDYAKAARLGLDAQNSAAAIRLEAEAKAGELLERMAKDGQRQAQRGDHQTERVAARQSLSDLGVTPDESSRWQAVAHVPAEKRDEYVAEAQQEEQEVTRAGLLRYAKAEAGRAWDRAVESVQTPESSRRAAVLTFRAAVQQVGEAFYRIDPLPSVDECEDEASALRAVLRQMEAPRKLEVVR